LSLSRGFRFGPDSHETFEARVDGVNTNLHQMKLECQTMSNQHRTAFDLAVPSYSTFTKTSRLCCRTLEMSARGVIWVYQLSRDS
jgi:hypothetical protein